MVRADIVRHKLAELADRVERVRAHRRPSAESLAADRDALDVVAFNLMLAVQACANLAAHVIADEGWRPVASLAESFDRLAEHGVRRARRESTIAYPQWSARNAARHRGHRRARAMMGPVSRIRRSAIPCE